MLATGYANLITNGLLLKYGFSLVVYVKMTLLDWICGRNKELTNKVTNPENPSEAGRVAQSLVRTNRWLRGIKTYRFPWYLTLALFQASINGVLRTQFLYQKVCIAKN